MEQEREETRIRRVSESSTLVHWELAVPGTPNPISLVYYREKSIEANVVLTPATGQAIYLSDEALQKINAAVHNQRISWDFDEAIEAGACWCPSRAPNPKDHVPGCPTYAGWARAHKLQIKRHF